MRRQYRQIKRFCREAQHWKREAIVEWQNRRFHGIVEYAYEHVPGYRQLYDGAGITPRDVQTVSDGKHLPFVTKELIRDHLEEFTARRIFAKRDLRYVTTSGSTGIPFGFYQTALSHWSEQAFMDLSWERAGFQPGDRSVILRGAFVGSEKKFWKRKLRERTLLLSSYHLAEGTYDRYAEKILRFGAKHLRAYPSTASVLADLILQRGDVGRLEFESLFLGSENLYPWQIERLHRAFPGAKLFTWYGHAEQVILASGCEHSQRFHVWPFYGCAEVVNSNGTEVGEGETGELVGTSFWSYATPFIRYRTMDLATKGKPGCPQCKREFSLLDMIEGRTRDALVCGDGRRVPVPSTSMHSDVFDNLNQFQFYQDTPGTVVFKMVKKRSFGEEDEKRISGALVEKLGDDMKLEMEFVDQVPPGPRGKYMALDQRLKIG